MTSAEEFAESLDFEFLAATGQHLMVDSAVRPADVQRKLVRVNRSAAPSIGPVVSSHEFASTVDFSINLDPKALRWLLWRLWYYKALGKVLIIQERKCIHVFIGEVTQCNPASADVEDLQITLDKRCPDLDNK